MWCLDGADALKAMILQLKDEIENQPVKPLNIDLSALMQKIKAAENTDEAIPAKKKLGEILVDEGS